MGREHAKAKSKQILDRYKRPPKLDQREMGEDSIRGIGARQDANMPCHPCHPFHPHLPNPCPCLRVIGPKNRPRVTRPETHAHARAPATHLTRNSQACTAPDQACARLRLCPRPHVTGPENHEHTHTRASPEKKFARPPHARLRPCVTRPETGAHASTRARLRLHPRVSQPETCAHARSRTSPHQKLGSAPVPACQPISNLRARPRLRVS